MANSPTQPLVDKSKGKFGPFHGQMFIGEMNYARIMRFLPDTVAGEVVKPGPPHSMRLPSTAANYCQSGFDVF